jgi:hypothetical protein
MADDIYSSVARAQRSIDRENAGFHLLYAFLAGFGFIFLILGKPWTANFFFFITVALAIGVPIHHKRKLAKAQRDDFDLSIFKK